MDQINDFVTNCGRNCLELNVNRTKEMVIDFWKSMNVSIKVIIMGNIVEKVGNYSISISGWW